MNELEQKQPSFPESEKAILGAILLDNAVMKEAAELLSPEDFYGQAHKRIFAAMLGLFENTLQINTSTLASELRKAESFEAAGGFSYLVSLLEGMPNFKTIAPFAAHLTEATRKRQMIRFGQEMAARAYEGDETHIELAEWASTRLDGFRPTTSARQSGSRYIGDMVDAQLERFARFHRKMSDAVPTGFPSIDMKMTGGGLTKGFSHILAARPSMGKTAFMLDVAENAASQGYSVYVATLEMASPVLMDRLFAIRANVPRWKVSPGISNIELYKLLGVADHFRDMPMKIDDRSRGISQMRQAIREMERERGRPVDLIIADYLQLFNTGKGGTRNDQVGANSRGWQELCKESNAAGLLLSQLTREHEKQGREPELTDLRDSGEIEQDARVVYLMYGERAEDVEGQMKPKYRDVHFKCPKQGEGPIFRTELSFDTELVTFRALHAGMSAMQTEIDHGEQRYEY